MSRAGRLLELMQCLRRHRFPVSGAALASELGISVRTLYRDIAALQVQGARIDGEPGVGLCFIAANDVLEMIPESIIALTALSRM